MAKNRLIKKRMTAVSTIQRITKTMQMIATSKFTNALSVAKRTKPYTEKVRQLVTEVSAAAGDIENPLINGPVEPANRELILVMSSDRGLCGAYNSNVFRAASAHVRQLRAAGTEIDLEIAGKKAMAAAKFNKFAVAQQHMIGDKPSYDAVAAIAERYMADFIAGKYDAVRVASMSFISNSQQRPQLLQILPLKPDADAKAQATAEATKATGAPAAVYEFSPSAEDLLTDLLPLAVKTSLFQAFNEAVVSEQIMRMIAMKAATENAKELGKLLRRRYNPAPAETSITTELMEVVSGAAALG